MTNSENTLNNHFDVVIVGGGMIGVSLGIALNGQGLKIAIIEANKFSVNTQPNYDDRAIALAYGSRCIFEGMGLWEKMQTLVTPIKDIHISDQGHFGVTRLNHRDENVEALGYVITARELGNVLLNSLKTKKDIQVFSPATLSDLEFSADSVRCSLQTASGAQGITARLVVAADGGQSTARKLLGLSELTKSYKQTAIIANVSTELKHNNKAYERFTPHGPLALLPMPENRYAIVWTRAKYQADKIMTLNDTDFLKQLQESFGRRLGNMTNVGKRHAYPLSLIRAKQQIQHRLVLIGNAAHTLHPIAGQGFNLGLRDVAALAQLIAEAQQAQIDIGQLDLLSRYLKWRKHDQEIIMGFTHGLVKVFSTTFAPVAMARNMGLITTDILPALKHLLARHTMGLAGKLPRLSMRQPL